MASFIYNSFWEDLATGAIDLDTDTIKVILTTSSYSENKDTHTKRSDVTNELSTANGYTAGGETVAVTIAKNTTTDTITYTFAAAAWATSTITARKAVYYKSRGGADTADELIAINDFGTNVSSTGGTFTVNASTITVNN